MTEYSIVLPIANGLQFDLITQFVINMFQIQKAVFNHCLSKADTFWKHMGFFVKFLGISQFYERGWDAELIVDEVLGAPTNKFFLDIGK